MNIVVPVEMLGDGWLRMYKKERFLDEAVNTA